MRQGKPYVKPDIFDPKDYPVRRLADFSQELIWVDSSRRVELSIPFGLQDYITVIEIPAGMQAVYSVYDIGKGVRDLSAYPHPKYRWVSATCIELEQEFTGVLQILRRTDVGNSIPEKLNPAYNHALHITQEIIGAVKALGRPPYIQNPKIPEPPSPPPPPPPAVPAGMLCVTKELCMQWLRSLYELHGRLGVRGNTDPGPAINVLRTAWEDFQGHLKAAHPEYTLFAPYPALSPEIDYSVVNQHSSLGVYDRESFTPSGHLPHHLVNCCPFSTTWGDGVISDEWQQVVPGYSIKSGGVYNRLKYNFIRDTHAVYAVPDNVGYIPVAVVPINPMYFVREYRNATVGYECVYWTHGTSVGEGYWRMRHYVPPYGFKAGVALVEDLTQHHMARAYTIDHTFIKYWFASARVGLVNRGCDVVIQPSETPTDWPEFPAHDLQYTTEQDVALVDTGGYVSLRDITKLHGSAPDFTGVSFPQTLGAQQVSWIATFFRSCDFLESYKIGSDSASQSKQYPSKSVLIPDVRSSKVRLDLNPNSPTIPLNNTLKYTWAWRQHELRKELQDKHEMYWRDYFEIHLVGESSYGVELRVHFDKVELINHE